MDKFRHDWQEMIFVSYQQLIADSIEFSNDIDFKFDVVVGVPRSGMVPATVIALHHNKPLSDIDSIAEGDTFYAGDRLIDKYVEINNILVVDDASWSTKNMAIAREKLEDLEGNIKYAAIYVAGKAIKIDIIDFHHKITELPRFFEWNLWHCNHLRKACVDIDGILCPDPTSEQNDDGEKYRDFIINSKPLVVPQRAIAHLVTNRLEKYRNLTVEWLKKWNIQFVQLHMLDLPDGISRRRKRIRGKFKAEVYSKIRRFNVFIESSTLQAKEIHSITGRPVLCMENKVLYER